jgi:hypothetical protein
MTAPALVQKLWNCNILRDDGLSYGDYVEQLTFLLFLKMADEQSRAPFNKPSPIPRGFGRDVLVKLDGDDLEPITVTRTKNSGGTAAHWASSSARCRTRSRTRPSFGMTNFNRTASGTAVDPHSLLNSVPS